MIPIKDNIPTDRFPLITVALILINVAVFVLFQHPTGFGSVDNTKVVKYGFIPYEVTHPGKHCGTVGELAGGDEVRTRAAVVCEGETVSVVTPAGPARERVVKVPGSQPPTLLTILTAMFMHGGILHIAGNMLFLWIFGNNVEDSMGHGRFALFYLLGGLAATALQTAIYPNSPVPNIGASGAIAAVLGGYILLFPRARVVTLVFIFFFFTIIEIPAFLMLGIWFAEQILFGSLDLATPTGAGGGVAYFAHIGGFAFGLLLIRAFVTRRKDADPPLPVY